MGHYRLNYSDSEKFVNIYINNPLHQVWDMIGIEFGSRRSDKFFLNEEYVADNISTENKRMADLFYFYDQLPEEHRVYLKIKWAYSDFN